MVRDKRSRGTRNRLRGSGPADRSLASNHGRWPLWAATTIAVLAALVVAAVLVRQQNESARRGSPYSAEGYDCRSVESGRPSVIAGAGSVEQHFNRFEAAEAARLSNERA
jgi:hypothetical protein